MDGYEKATCPLFYFPPPMACCVYPSLDAAAAAAAPPPPSPRPSSTPTPTTTDTNAAATPAAIPSPAKKGKGKGQAQDESASENEDPRSFQDIVSGKETYEVCRLFLASLQLVRGGRGVSVLGCLWFVWLWLGEKRRAVSIRPVSLKITAEKLRKHWCLLECVDGGQGGS